MRTVELASGRWASILAFALVPAAQCVNFLLRKQLCPPAISRRESRANIKLNPLRRSTRAGLLPLATPEPFASRSSPYRQPRTRRVALCRRCS
eukprot:COSAG06_NODE_37194_length_438_cov_0.743363_2_plen_92_part_01